MLSGGTFYLGVGNNWFTGGEISELIIYNAALSPSQQDQVYNYLATKYNLGINPNAPQIANFGTSSTTFEPLFQGTKVAASGFGANGDQVSVVGTNFTGVTTVTVNNIPIPIFTVLNNNNITFTLPDALNYSGQDFTGKIRLVNSTGTGISTQDLQVLFTNSAPSTVINVARSGGQFAIEGTDLSQLNAISVGGVNLPYIYNSVTKKITVSVNTLVGAGLQKVWLRQGTTIGNFIYEAATINGVNSIAAPIITSISPQSGAINSTFNIVGTNFGASPGDNVVFLGAVQAQVISNTATTATVKVPVGTNYQSLSLMNLNSSLVAEARVPFNTTFTGNAVLGTNTFSNYIRFSSGYAYGYFSAVGDLDNDGKPDMVISYRDQNVIGIYKNINAIGNTFSGASFQSHFILATGSYPSEVVLKDLDNDGKLDIAVSNYNSLSISVFKNISNAGTLNTASFAPKVDITIPSGSYGLAAADIDNDGKLDLISAGFSAGNNLYINKNQFTNQSITAASFATPVTYGIGANSYPFDVEAADLNGDGKIDIITGNKNNSTISVFENIASAGVINASSLNSPLAYNLPLANTTGNAYPALNIKTADFDNDGKLDIAVSRSNTNTISIFRNKYSSGSIVAATFNERVDLSAGTNPYGIAVGDLNGDNKIDLVASSYGEAKMYVFQNNGIGGTITGTTFAPKVDLIAEQAFSTQPNIVDMDGDGKPDITSSDYNYGYVYVFRNLITDPAIITGFTPTSGLPLSKVTLTGSNFGDVAQVRMGTVTGGVVIYRDATSIVVRIPAGATTNQISLVNNSGTQATSASIFSISGNTPFAVITSVKIGRASCRERVCSTV